MITGAMLNEFQHSGRLTIMVNPEGYKGHNPPVELQLIKVDGGILILDFKLQNGKREAHIFRSMSRVRYALSIE